MSSLAGTELREHYRAMSARVVSSFGDVFATMMSLLSTVVLDPSESSHATLEEIVLGVSDDLDEEFGSSSEHMIFAGVDGFFKAGNGMTDAFYALQEAFPNPLSSVWFYGAVSTYTWNIMSLLSLPCENEFVLEPSTVDGRTLMECYLYKLSQKFGLVSPFGFTVVASDISEARTIVLEFLHSISVPSYESVYVKCFPNGLANGCGLNSHLAEIVMRGEAVITTERVPMVALNVNGMCMLIDEGEPTETIEPTLIARPTPVIASQVGAPTQPQVAVRDLLHAVSHKHAVHLSRLNPTAYAREVAKLNSYAQSVGAPHAQQTRAQQTRAPQPQVVVRGLSQTVSHKHAVHLSRLNPTAYAREVAKLNSYAQSVGAPHEQQTRAPQQTGAVPKNALPDVPNPTVKKWTSFCHHCNVRNALDFSVLEDPIKYKDYLMCVCGAQHTQVSKCENHNKWFFKSMNADYRTCPQCK